MSLTKEILFEDNPAHDHIRQAVSEAAVRRIAAFPFSVPTRRKNLAAIVVDAAQ